jgi:hypothetical protein
VRDPERPRHASRVGEVVDRAAAAVLGLAAPEGVVHLHRQADDVVSGGLQDVRGSRGIDPARHGDSDLHDLAEWPRSTVEFPRRIQG